MNKKKIAWITDSTAFITKELADHPDVYIVPLTITFGDESFEDGVELQTNGLYERIRSYKEIPKTSQPAAGRFAELFENLKETYESAIAIHISGKLSGTINSCLTGAELAGFDVKAVDSRSMSYAITTLIYKGMEMEKNGHSSQEISEKLRVEAEKSENYILLGSLDQFYKGGRMSGTAYLLGSLLHIKPIIQINSSGEFALFDKVRSEKKAIKRMLELFGEAYQKHSISQVQILHGNIQDKAEKLAEEFRVLFPSLDIFIGEISSTIAVHSGEGTLATMWHNE
jgi:DegV family protein with EDD domain